jgi:hypothetical protein
MFQTDCQRPIAILFLMLIAYLSGGSAISVQAAGCDAANFKGARNFLVGQEPFAVVTADFNQDGKADIAAANRASSLVAVLLGDGNGRLGSATTFPVGANPEHLITADFNGDGKADFALANQSSNSISLSSSATALAAFYRGTAQFIAP